MASDYRIFLTDSFDWGYSNTSKAQAKTFLASLGFDIVAEAHGLIVADCRYSPGCSEAFLAALDDEKLMCDECYMQRLPEGGLCKLEP